MRQISRVRFDALAGYARDPRTLLTAGELAYFEHANERVLGILVRDRFDNDFAGIVLARDELKQYRWTTMTDFEPKELWARARLRPKLEQAALAPDEEHYQGHSKRVPVDFFSPVVSRDRLNQNFRILTEESGWQPAKGIIEPMMRWYEDADGNFVEQFQTTGFDARMWELYLFATLVELGFIRDRKHAVPDFIARGLRGSIAIEAVTVNPTVDKSGNVVPRPPTETDEQLELFLREYMPIKFAGPLTTKLNKEYWAREQVREIPFSIAVQDFSAPGSMIVTRPALQLYLYGFDQETETKDGKKYVRPRHVTKHKWNGKEIDSGFFFLPGAENVSAVLFSSSGTLSKFNRMGYTAEFGMEGVVMRREGYAYQDGQEAQHFIHELGPGYSETWVEGLDVYHNPRAVHPISPALLPGAAHHRLLDSGIVESLIPRWHPIGSRTLVGVES